MSPGKEIVRQRMGRVSVRTERKKEGESHLEEVNQTIEGEQKTHQTEGKIDVFLLNSH